MNMIKKIRKGFTLIELMIVIAIIAILAAMAIPQIFKYRQNANRAKCIANLKQIQNAVESQRAISETDVANISVYTANASAGKAYFKDWPTCPVAKASYSLDGATDNTWIPVCPGAGSNSDCVGHNL